READQWFAERAARREPLIQARALLAEEAIRGERGGETSEPVEREAAAGLEGRDDDVLHRARAVHELEQRHVLGLEAQIRPGAAIAARVLDDRVRRAVAVPQVGALEVRDRVRDERCVVETLAQRLPDAVHHFARRTANAGTGRLMPLSSSSPTGCVSKR